MSPEISRGQKGSQYRQGPYVKEEEGPKINLNGLLSFILKIGPIPIQQAQSKVENGFT